MGRRRSQILVISILLLATAVSGTYAGSRHEAESAFEDGVRLYQAERYADAWACWRRVIDEGYLSTPLLLNLGNAAYRLGELGWSVYYYELARRLDPADPDVASNLLLARGEALGVDRTAGGSRFLRWFDSLQERITPDRATHLAAGSLWFFCLLISLSWILPGLRVARALRWVGVAVLGVALLLAGAKGLQQSIRPEAITLAGTAARSEPIDGASIEFRLPAGSPVDLGREAAGWQEIVVSTRLRGWVPEEEVAGFAEPR